MQFSFPGGIGSHCTPEMPGSIHEGGELGYSVSHAFGAAFDNPDLIVTVVIGDGEAETGPLAGLLHSNKFLNPIRDGAVLPILHLNGYKIANPTLLARIRTEELERSFGVSDGLRISWRVTIRQSCTRRWPRRSRSASRKFARFRQEARERQAGTAALADGDSAQPERMDRAQRGGRAQTGRFLAGASGADGGCDQSIRNI